MILFLNWGPRSLVFGILGGALLAGIAVVLLGPFDSREAFLVGALLFIAKFLAGVLVGFLVVFDDERMYVLNAASARPLLDLGAPGLFRLTEIDPWSAVSALVHYLTLGGRSGIVALNSLLGVVTALLVLRGLGGSPGIGRTIKARRAFLGLCLAPPMLLLSGTALKEQVIALALAMIAFRVPTPPVISRMLASLGFLLLVVFRSSLALAVLPVTVWALLGAGRQLETARLRLIGLAVVSILVIAGVRVSVGKFDWIEKSKAVLVVTGVDQRGTSTLLATDARIARFLTAEDVWSPSNMGLSIARGLFSPALTRPVRLPSKATLLEFIMETVWWYWAVPYFVLAIFRSLRSGDGKLDAAMLVVVITFAVASLSVLTAAPEVTRYRWACYPLLAGVVLLAPMDGTERIRRRVFRTWWAAGSVYSLAYLLA